MNRPLRLALLCASSLLLHFPAHAAEISLYTDDNFKGRVVVLRDTTDDLSRMNFNDTVSSIKVASGSWEVCAHANFKGECKTFERGDYRSMPGMNDKISSVRLADGRGGGRPGTPSSPSSPEPSPSPIRITSRRISGAIPGGSDIVILSASNPTLPSGRRNTETSPERPTGPSPPSHTNTFSAMRGVTATTAFLPARE